MKQWDTRKLTQFGRISVFTHCMFTVPTLKILNDLYKQIRNFVQENKPHKINTQTAVQKYDIVGRNMVDVIANRNKIQIS